MAADERWSLPVVDLASPHIDSQRLVTLLANDCLVAPAFLFSNDTNGLRLNYTRLAKDDLPLFQERFTKITQQLKEQTHERNH